MTLIFAILAVVGAVSPLLTLAWLWQLKEWRRDRLLEHLRREGWIRQLWGTTRPALVALYGLALLVQDATIVLPVCLLLLAALTAVHSVLGRQRTPVPTKKALMVTVTAGLLTIVAAIVLALTTWNVLLPVLVLLQPLTLALAWLLWYPVDAFLKERIIAQARALRENNPELTVIGVTGSVGKTTTKELLACVLKDLTPAVTPVHVNSEIGVARWLISAIADRPSSGSGPALMIVEMGAYRQGEIALMCSYARPTIGVVTYVGMQHVALFGSQEKLFAAKSELVRALPVEGRAFLNGDNELARKMATISPCPTVIVGTGGRCDLEAFDIEETGSGIRFRVKDVLFDVPLHGTHNVTNILLAIAAGEHLGVRLERMRDLLRTFAPLAQTFTVRDEAGVRILDDTHNSSVASVKAAIAWARTQPEQHKILLATGLIEMGEMQSPAERELGALAAQVFERIVVIDPQSAGNFAVGAGKNVENFSATSVRVPTGALLVCAGRMSASTVKHLLPSHTS